MDPLIEKLIGTRRKVFRKTVAPPAQMGAFYTIEARGLAQFRNFQRNFRTELRRVYRQYVENHYLRAFKQRAREIFHIYYAGAFRLGQNSALGLKTLLSDADREWIQKSARQESSYWNDFCNDVHNERTGKLAPLARIDNYVASLEAIYHAGKVVNLPQRMAISWLVNPVAENCRGCLWLERNGPFVKENLPTTPGAGVTSCRHNCRCELIYTPVTQRQYDVYRSKQTARSVIAMLKRLM